MLYIIYLWKRERGERGRPLKERYTYAVRKQTKISAQKIRSTSASNTFHPRDEGSAKAKSRGVNRKM